ncbi:MAG: murein L,D-transpeptidase catalytic domain-containing protein, partial [Bacteriovorax sp.]
MSNRFFSLFIAIVLCFSARASDYSHLDPDHLIPAHILKTAVDYFENHQENIRNKRFLGVIDFKLHNSKERFYIIDLDSGRVEKYLVAHGKNSDPNFKGYASKFSNTIDSKMSSLGFFLTAETYNGSHGYSLRLEGLSVSNSNARERDIVIHPAD